jgi:NTP pyrophosphatase (non-canonical NTP hydrolase)
LQLTPEEIEDRHLAAITQADFVWLHAPEGYVGPSASLEIGHARALGIPVFTSEPPFDETIRSYVRVVDSPSEVSRQLQTAPGHGLAGLQAYYRRIAARRGWQAESPTETMLLLTEELGELAREVRRATGLSRDHAYDGAVGAEIADVQLYLVHLANALGVDLSDAVTAKEAVNENRYTARVRAEVA